MFAGTFAPQNWAFCNGALIAISQNEALFNLIGTTYGGDGQTTFALPNLLSRMPMHTNASNPLGSISGQESVPLTSVQIPSHTHAVNASLGGGTPSNSPSGNFWSASVMGQYSSQPPSTALNAAAVGSIGNNLPHENRPPYQAVTFIIALFGIFPSQS